MRTSDPRCICGHERTDHELVKNQALPLFESARVMAGRYGECEGDDVLALRAEVAELREKVARLERSQEAPTDAA